MKVRELLQAQRGFEKREKVDPSQIVLFCDGSGHVMIPCAGDGTAMESTFDFDSLAQLERFLERGKVPEEEAAVADWKAEIEIIRQAQGGHDADRA